MKKEDIDPRMECLGGLGVFLTPFSSALSADNCMEYRSPGNVRK
jgi:hypothetical protein